ncbi:nose resistant to fluoxetine protein 6 isoform X2 [Anabrus simplex]|uniref:nose resistant to fluoxetine protein 6 isoform X2 n=1 Tax=Anabrus simplex TaxID=316456 RepID=UPI0035A2E080
MVGEGGEHYLTDTEKANLFSREFRDSVEDCQDLETVTEDREGETQRETRSFSFTNEDIFREIQLLQQGKAAGSDQITGEDLIIVGLCLPSTCSPAEISPRVESYISSRQLLVQNVYNVDMKLQQVRSLQDDGKWILQPGYLITVILLLIFFILVIIGTVYDVTIWQPRLKVTKRKTLLKSSEEKELIAIKIINTDTMNKNESSVAKLALPNSQEEDSTQGPIGKFLLCFSSYSNTSFLLNTQLSPQSIPAVHGLKFLGMIWILLVHTIFYGGDFLDNKPLMFRKSDGFMVQVLSNAAFSVDTFFFLSGFLMSYLFYKSRHGREKSKMSCFSGIKEIGLTIIRRYLRLTPAYLAMVGIAVLNMTWYSHTSLFHMSERVDILCSRYWWRNILYINNFFSRDEMCMSWSWYLSNDMQFFIIATCLLFLSTRYFKLSATILVVMVVGSSLLTGYTSYIYHYIPTLDQQLALVEVFYDPPWTRIGPHFVGVATGYLVVQLDGKLHLRKHSVIIAWLLGAACNVSVLFGLYEHNLSPLTAAVYVGLSRTAWGVGLAWIMIACCTHHAGIINTVLSFRGWVPFSRLTYCAYLLNPLIMTSVFLYGETTQHIDLNTMATDFLGYTGITFCCAYVLYLVFEAPNLLLMKWVLRGHAKRKISEGT